MIKKIILLSLVFSISVGAYAEDKTHLNVFIFLSFSMPKESIKEWMMNAHKINATCLTRGLVDQSFKETTKRLMEIMEDKQLGLSIDPILFKRFHIEKVPAVVLIDEECLREEKCENYDVIYGNVKLKYALKEIALEKKEYTEAIEILLNKLKD